MNPVAWVNGALGWADTSQRKVTLLGFLWAVVRKFGDDAAGSLAALVAYYGFLSLFPLLLVLVTVLGMVATPTIRHDVVHSALGQFPVVGNQLAGPNGIHALKAGSVPALIIGLLGLIWGALGISQAAQRAMAGVWNVPQVDRFGFPMSQLRGLAFLLTLLLNVVATTGLAGVTTFGGPAWYSRLAAGVLTLVLDVGLYVVSFRVLTPKVVRTRDLLLGASLAGAAWALLQYVGTFLVSHELRHSSQIYGVFATVLGLVAFLYLAAEITLYAAEVNVVRVRQLYPRRFLVGPLTAADRWVLVNLAKAEERIPDQHIEVGFVRGGEETGPEQASGAPDEAGGARSSGGPTGSGPEGPSSREGSTRATPEPGTRSSA